MKKLYNKQANEIDLLEKRLVFTELHLASTPPAVEKEKKNLGDPQEETDIEARLTAGTDEITIQSNSNHKSNNQIEIPKHLKDDFRDLEQTEFSEKLLEAPATVSPEKIKEELSDKIENNKVKFENNITDEFLSHFAGKGILSWNKFKENASLLGHLHLSAAVSSSVDASLALDKTLKNHQGLFFKTLAMAGVGCNSVNRFGRMEIQRWTAKAEVLEKTIIPELKLRRDNDLGFLHDTRDSLGKIRFAKWLNPITYYHKGKGAVEGVKDKWEHLRGTELGKQQITAIATINKALKSAESLLETAKEKRDKWKERKEDISQAEGIKKRADETNRINNKFFFGETTPNEERKKDINNKLSRYYENIGIKDKNIDYNNSRPIAQQEKEWKNAVKRGNFGKLLKSKNDLIKEAEKNQGLESKIDDKPSNEFIKNLKKEIHDMENSIHYEIDQVIEKRFKTKRSEAAEKIYANIHRLPFTSRNIQIASRTINEQTAKAREDKDLKNVLAYLQANTSEQWFKNSQIVNLNWYNEEFTANFMRTDKDAFDSLGKDGWQIEEILRTTNGAETKMVKLKNFKRDQNIDNPDCELIIYLDKNDNPRLEIRTWKDENEQNTKENAGISRIERKSLRILRGISKR